MIIPINRALEYATRQLNSREQKIVRKFLEHYNNITLMAYIDKDNLNRSIIYRKYFLDEIDKRYLSGDMQFLTSTAYGILRHYIKSRASSFMRDYINKKRVYGNNNLR
jgi:hypothetical protein